MPESAPPNTLSSAAGRALCRLIRGVPGAVADGAALAELERLGLVARVSPDECRDALHWADLTREAEGFRETLLKMRPPAGAAALVPGATGRFRKRAAGMQAQLDALGDEAREIERRYSAGRRADWPHLATAAPLPDGGGVLVAPAGQRAACAFWTGAVALPGPEAQDAALAHGAEAAARLHEALAGWWQLPPEDAWLSCAIVASGSQQDAGAAASTLRTLYEWLARGKFWGQNPFPAVTTLAAAPSPGTAARTAAELAEALRSRSFGVGAAVFTAACRLAARPSWIEPQTRVGALEWLVRRADDLGLVDQHRALVALAPLACLPRPVTHLGEALGPIRDALRARHPGDASTVEVSAVLLAGSGFYHHQRQEGQSLLSRDDPVAQTLAGRYEALHAPLREMDGPAPAPGHRVDVLAAIAALLPGPAEGVLGALSAARSALRDAGAPAEACRVPAAVALALGVYGGPLGIAPGDVAVELLTAEAMVQAAWAGRGPGREIAPSFSSV